LNFGVSKIAKSAVKALMKTIQSIVACMVAAALSTTAFALTTEREITPEYARENPREFFVSAAKGKDGLIDFTITRSVAAPRYHVAHLAIRRDGKLIAASHTPLFGRAGDNKFHFSISADAIAESKFSLSDSALDASGEVPLPGTVIHHIRLLDFVPTELLKQ
jgi:hypothetical protein